MASFCVFSNASEKTTHSYNEFIKRLERETQSKLGDKPITCAADFTYYSKYKNAVKQHVFKDFIYQLRMKVYDGTSVLICENLTPTFKCFIRLIERLKTPNDRLSTISYYGNIRKIICGFMNYFTSTIDEAEKNLDKYTFLIDSVRNQLLLEIIDHTIALNDENQKAFLEEYLPLRTEKEEQNYQNVIDAHAKCLAGLTNMRAAWEKRQNKLEIFMKDTFEASIRKISELCYFVHNYIAMMLADRLYEITESINESGIRIASNQRKCKEDYVAHTNSLIHKLYEKNKELAAICRLRYKDPNDAAEVCKVIDRLIDRIIACDREETLARLELETRFWNTRLKDFNEIASVLVKIRFQLDYLNKELEEFKSIKASEVPGSDMMCFDAMHQKITKRINYYKKKKVDMCKALITFFSVKGTNRTLYTNRNGDSFFIDEFNHQNYLKNYGLKYYHVNCDGEYVEHSENKLYYFDEYGRYILNEKDEKIYQVAGCTSQYQLDENDLFQKITKDCGHSEKHNPDCRLAEIKDMMTQRMILPKVNPIDITGTLDTETVHYLWDHFGGILAEVLTKVATAQPSNPIHFIGHTLLKRRFEASTSELRNFRKMAQLYRKNIEKKRLDEGIAVRRAWQAKLIKRTPSDRDIHIELPEVQQALNWALAETMGYL